jgi:hypothetical protein
MGAAALLEALVTHPDWVAEAGRNARAAFLQNYDLTVGVGRISAALKLPRAATTPEALATTVSAPGD